MERGPDPRVPFPGLVTVLASVLAQSAVARLVRPLVALPTAVVAAVGLPAALRLIPPRRAIRWITVGGRHSGWFGQALLGGRRNGREREGGAEPPGPLPALHDLLGVVPNLRNQEAGTATLTPRSLARHGDRFLVRGKLLPNADPPGSEVFWVVRRVAVVAAEDRGTAHHGRSRGGGGDSWRFDPAIPPAAADLRLSVPALRRQRASPPLAGRLRAEERTEPGPWTSRVPLGGTAPAAGIRFP